MAAMSAPLLVGACPACKEALFANADFLAESLADPTIAPIIDRQKIEAATDPSPWETDDTPGGKVNLVVRLIGLKVAHACGTQAPRE